MYHNKTKNIKGETEEHLAELLLKSKLMQPPHIFTGYIRDISEIFDMFGNPSNVP